MPAGDYLATCFCGGVELAISGTPLFSGYCHCESCRAWLGAPVHAATLWPRGDVQLSQGADLLATYKKTERSHRKHCTTCGGSVLSDHPSEGMIDVPATLIRDFPFEPTMHVHYGEHVLEIRDGLPKYRDLPEAFGGSGKTLAE